MSESEKTLVTIATYNEIDNIPILVDEIFKVVPDVDILVIDDNSPDGTGRWCDDRRRSDQRIDCLHRDGKLGLGTAIIAGMRYGIARGYKHVLNMDADFSHHPRYLPTLIDGMDPADGESVDVMIGSRYVPKGGVEGWPIRRQLMSRCVNLYARTMLGLKSKDCSGAYRCYRTELLAKLDFDEIRSRGYSFQEEVLWHLRRVSARFGETPIIFTDRQRGSSKIDSKEAIEALRIIFALGIQNITSR